MKKYIAIIGLLLLAMSGFSQVYQSMPQYGYGPVKRFWIDSTLSIPTVCGVPTLKSYVTKNAAIAYDSCNKRLYYYDPKLMAWDTIKGGATFDSTSLSNRINLKLNISDTLGMLSKYLRKTDTSSLSSRIDLRVKYSDTSSFLQPYLRKTDTASLSSRIDLRVKYSDTASMLTPYLRKYDTTSMLFPYLRKADTTAMLSSYFNKINYGLSMSGQTLSVDSSTLSTKYLRIVDTINKWVSSVTKLNDSTIRVVKDGTTTDITITSSATITSATRLSTQVYNSTGSTITKGSVVYISGRHSSGLPTVALAQANNEASSYKTFALIESDISTSNSGTAIQMGNIGNLNLPTSTYTDGDLLYLSPTTAGGITLTKPSAPNHIVKLGSVTRAHPTFGSIQINIQNGWELDELSDVSIAVVPADSTLLQFSRVDSLWHDVSVTNAIGSKYIKPADTSVFLRDSDSSIYQTKYRTDTMRTNVYNVLNTKLNLSDSTIYQTKYRSDTMRTNVYTSLNGKQATLTNPVTGTGTSGSLTKFNGTSTVTNATVDLDYLQQDMQLVALQAMGSSIKGYSVGSMGIADLSSALASGNQSLYLSAIYIPKAVTITGIRWYQGANGVFTASNYNGVGLYTISGGTLTLVASSTNDGNCFQQGGNSWQSKAFSSTYAASAGTIVYAALLYSSSSATTAPTFAVVGSSAGAYASINTFDFTNSQRFYGGLASQTSLPSSVTLSSTTANIAKIATYLY